MNNIDDTDRELLALLRQDARMPVATLAAKLRVARGTVQNRMKRLERDGVIVGYTVRVKPQAEAHRIRALMTIVVEGNRGAEVLHALRGHPNVTGLHSTNGRWDLIAELRADSLEAFDRALGNIRLIAGITSTETSLLLSTHKV
jgi:DNA-binding Lrp family transcriptional regulator